MADHIDVFEFDSGKKGAHILILGAIHGNEICGPQAIREAIQKIENGSIILENGKVTFIPVCNPEAYKQNVRYIDRNLNRFMFPKEKIESYEDGLTNQLCPHLEKADVLLDLHSYMSGNTAFTFIQTPDGPETEYAKCLGGKYLVYGFAESFEKLSEERKKMGMGTTEYARLFGTVAVTHECGLHEDPQSVVNAGNAILNALRYFSLIEKDRVITEDSEPDLLKINYNVIKEREGSLVHPWENFTPVEKNQLIALYDDGEEVRAKHDGFLVLPRKKLNLGEEWFYLAKKTEKNRATKSPAS